MGVQGGGAGGLVFLRRQRVFQFRVLFRPFVVTLVERLRQSAPADVTGENFLFLRRRQTFFRLDLFQSTDRRHIVLKFRLLTARAKILIRDVKIAPFLSGFNRFHNNFSGKHAVADFLFGGAASHSFRGGFRQLSAVNFYILRH